MSFYEPSECGRLRAFRVVMPKAPPYVAAERRLELSRMAKAGNADPEKFITYSSKLPTRKPDGRPMLSFGRVVVVPSVKNFIVEDADNKPLFMIYRVSSATCTVKVWPPITPLVAFGWAVAISTLSN
jgi:hypothetical protein